MKRLFASRKLKRKCIYCQQEFKKGDIYYKKRVVVNENGLNDDVLNTYEYLVCPRCKYEIEKHNKAFEKFKEHCTHPKKFIQEEWSYIPREAVMQPDHLECKLCGKWI